MKKLFLIFVLVLFFVLLYGCTISINPTDLNPTKKYSVVGDTNSLDTNSSGNNLPDNNSNTLLDNNTPNLPDTNQPSLPVTPPKTTITLNATEVAKHNTRGNCWMIINNKVYDLSDYVGHPGGNTYIPYCGKEATVGYNTEGGKGSSHSSYADLLLSNYLVGALGQEIILN